MIKRLFEISLGTLFFSAAVQANSITVSDPVVRAMPVGVPNTAGYVELVSTTGNDALLAASCEGINKTELHTLLMEDGMMKMRPVDKIELPHGEAVALTQGGYHLMMMGVSKTPEVGDQLLCTLSFANADAQAVSFDVKRVEQTMNHRHHH